MTIPSVTKKRVVDVLTTAMVEQGYSPKNIGDYNAVYSKRSASLAAMVLFGSQYDSVPEARVNYTVVDTDGGVRVIATIEMITNPGSAFERTMDLSQSASAQSWQNLLEQIRASLTSQ